MPQKERINYSANAFVSCSLRPDDKDFIEFVESILRCHGIEPYGTVGRYSAAPTNTSELMKENIPHADMVAIIATPRYIQKDIQTGAVTRGLSEMLHVEAGMAFMANKPLIVFVQEGTHVGNFLPNVTQYITLNGRPHDYNLKLPLISSLLNSAYSVVCHHRNSVRLRQEQASNESFKNGVIGFLTCLGAVAFINIVSSDD